MMNYSRKKFTILVFSLLTHFSVSATLIPLELDITASIDLDTHPTNGSYLEPVAATHNDIISIGTNTAFINDLVVTGDSTNVISLTDTNQTLDFNTLIMSTNVPSFETSTIAYDFDVQINNTHATDDFTIDLSFDYYHIVHSFNDAYSRSNISLFDTDGEFFFSDIMSDSFYGNEFNGIPDPSGLMGGPVSDSGIFDFSYTLSAGESVSFGGFIEAFFGFSLNSGDVHQNSIASLSINSIQQTRVGQPPIDVPEPNSLILFLTVLLLCVRTQSKRIL